MGYGNLIRDQRIRKGWTQTQLSEVSGVSFSVISRMERGETVGRGSSIAKVTNALDLDAALVQRYLSDDTATEKPPKADLLSVALRIRNEIDELVAVLERQKEDESSGGRRLAHALVGAHL